MHKPSADEYAAESAITHGEGRRKIHQFGNHFPIVPDPVMHHRRDPGNGRSSVQLRMLASHDTESKLGGSHGPRPRSEEKRQQRDEIGATIVNWCRSEKQHSGSPNERSKSEIPVGRPTSGMMGFVYDYQVVALTRTLYDAMFARIIHISAAQRLERDCLGDCMCGDECITPHRQAPVPWARESAPRRW